MSLVQAINDLAVRVGRELRSGVTPGHPGLARAWANFGWARGRIRLQAGYNIEKVLRLAPGRYRIVFAAPLADAHYCWLAFARSDDPVIKLAIARTGIEDQTADDMEIACTTIAGTLADAAAIHLVVYR